MSEEELAATFGRVGTNVLVDRSVRLVNPKNITIGSNTRIDLDAVLIAGTNPINIGSYIHISYACHFSSAGGPILLEDFTSAASRVSIYTATDDFREGFLINPQVPFELRKVRGGPVIFRKHAVVGCGSVLLPEVELGFGAAVGALSLVNRSVERGIRVAGIPAKPIGTRDCNRLMQLEAQI